MRTLTRPPTQAPVTALRGVKSSPGMMKPWVALSLARFWVTTEAPASRELSEVLINAEARAAMKMAVRTGGT